MSKRHDLQAIRGLAITSVLLFHFFPDKFPNGFVGVDQFFVLSGFLISLVLSRERSINSSSIVDFYYRRVKRIFPLYLFFILLALLSLFVVFPVSNLDSNLSSAWPALFYYTNLIAGSDLEKEYNAMLRVAEDVFTHTWSLAVEIQFYFFVPFIFLCLSKLSRRGKFYFLSFLAMLSLVYYSSSEEMLAFNSVFARMWQFILGICCFLLTYVEKNEKAEQISLLGNESDDFDMKSVQMPEKDAEYFKKIFHVLGSSFMLLIFLQSLYTTPMPAYQIRYSCTLVTGLLIICGDRYQSPILNNRILVYLGDISYAVYLFHWPIVAYFKLNHPDDQDGFLFGLLISIIISILISETYEKQYLKLSKRSILQLVAALYLLNITVICGPGLYEAHLASKFDASEDTWAPYTPPDVMTPEEKLYWSNRVVNNDRPLIISNKCNYVKNKKPWGVCHFKGLEKSAKYKVLSIGNSHTPTATELVYDYCKSKMNRLTMKAAGAAEPLINGTLQQADYLKIVAMEKPDILFHVTRHLKTMIPLPEDDPNDVILHQMIGNLKFLQRHVKKKIFLVNAIPRPIGTAPRKIHEMFKNGQNMTDETQNALIEPSADWMLARQRMAQLIKTCDKCELIDYWPIFNHNGTFEIFDPETKFSYYTYGIHFTAPALKKLKPLFKSICDGL